MKFTKIEIHPLPEGRKFDLEKIEGSDDINVLNNVGDALKKKM